MIVAVNKTITVRWPAVRVCGVFACLSACLLASYSLSRCRLVSPLGWLCVRVHLCPRAFPRSLACSLSLRRRSRFVSRSRPRNAPACLTAARLPPVGLTAPVCLCVRAKARLWPPCASVCARSGTVARATESPRLGLRAASELANARAGGWERASVSLARSLARAPPLSLEHARARQELPGSVLGLALERRRSRRQRTA